MSEATASVAEEGTPIADTHAERSFLQQSLHRIFPAKPTPQSRIAKRSAWRNPIGWLFFSSAYHVVRNSISRQLFIEDIESLRPDESSEIMSNKVKFYHNHYREKNSNHPLLRALEKSYRNYIWTAGFCQALSSFLNVTHCLLISLFITYFTRRNENLYGWKYSFGAGVGIFAISAIGTFLATIAASHASRRISIIAASMKTSIDSVIIQKAFVISPLAKRTPPKNAKLVTLKWTDGVILNILNVDSERILSGIMDIHYIWMPLVLIPYAIGLAYYLIGWPGIAGACVVFLFYPFLWLGSKLKGNSTMKLNILADIRNNLVNDVIRNIRFIKSFCWEEYFYTRIKDVRDSECRGNYKNGLLQGIVLITSVESNRIPPLIAILLLSYFGNSFQSNKVLPFFALWSPLADLGFLIFPAINKAINGYLSATRVEEFLAADERSPNHLINEACENAISLNGAKFAWEQESDDLDSSSSSTLATSDEKEKLNTHQFTLQPVSLDIRPNELVAIVGASGSGKSSLVSGLVGDMPLIDGSFQLKSSIAYCPQRPWIQSSTIRDNVLFGLPYDKDKYDGIVYDCALVPDLNTLAAKDLTQMGERGINLSGGQKQRVQLARTLYLDRDIIVLDDPLSAVDASTGRHLFENVIAGRLKDKCRILITHQLQFLSQCDRIMFMENGNIVAFDTYDKMLENVSFVKFMQFCEQHEEEEDLDEKDAEPGQIKVSEASKDDNIIQNEERAISSVKWSTYHKYINFCGSYSTLAIMIFICVLSQAVNVCSNLSIAWWTDRQWDLPNKTYIGIVFGILFGHFFTWTPYLVLMFMFCIRGNREMSLVALNNIMNSPVSFFDQNLIGRIINRFTVDLNHLETDHLYITWRVTLLTMFGASIVGLLIYYVHLMAAILAPWCISLAIVIYIFKSTPREMKRLEAMANSKLSASLSEGYNGRACIVSNDQSQLFLKDLYSRMDELNSIRIMTCTAVGWASVRESFLSCLYYFIFGILVVNIGSKIEPGVAGVLMTESRQLIPILGLLMRVSTAFQSSMVSVERIQQYCDIEQEGTRRVEGFNKDKKWPLNGAISFQNVDMRYRESGDLNLRNVNIDIPGRAKVGIVGRTGAGKSSLFEVLLRMVKISSGKVCIDGVDITNDIGLQDLREQVAVIPQDPTLFQGTVRSNLDPLGLKEDYVLNAALKNVSLTSDSKMGFSLDMEIDAGGENLSNGQRQLMALARALVKDSRIIISDEATSSIDYETDAKIQNVMMNMHDKTVISIAHRMRTVIHYDYICVMSEGSVAEFDTPLNLFDKADSLFRGMCEESKLSREDL